MCRMSCVHLTTWNVAALPCPTPWSTSRPSPRWAHQLHSCRARNDPCQGSPWSTPWRHWLVETWEQKAQNIQSMEFWQISKDCQKGRKVTSHKMRSCKSQNSSNRSKVSGGPALAAFNSKNRPAPQPWHRQHHRFVQTYSRSYNHYFYVSLSPHIEVMYTSTIYRFTLCTFGFFHFFHHFPGTTPHQHCKQQPAGEAHWARPDPAPGPVSAQQMATAFNPSFLKRPEN